MESIMKKNEGKVAWVYKHFPLPFHPNAKPSAIAAECIATLGGNDKFWQFTDGVFTDTIKLSDAEYLKAAGKLGLTAETFNKCIADASIAAIVDKDQAEGSSLGVSGTPNTFIVKNEGGKLTVLESVNGALPEAAIQAIVDKYVK
jgi:protein-disulfide isomerase